MIREEPVYEIKLTDPSSSPHMFSCLTVTHFAEDSLGEIPQASYMLLILVYLALGSAC